MSKQTKKSNFENDKIVHLIDFDKKKLLSDNYIVGLCHGNFDVLHIGHIKHFESARNKVNFLVVGLTSDNFIFKGKDRPLFNQSQRAHVLASLSMIDLVVIVDHESSVPLINTIKPQFYFKGVDYRGYKDPTGRLELEENAVVKNGGKIFFTSTPKLSSTRIIHQSRGTNKLRYQSDKPELSDLKFLSSELQRKKVLVIGETIFDKYNKCQPLGKSAKHPIVAQQVINSEIHLGGSLAISKHLAGLGCEVALITNFNNSERDLVNGSIPESLKILNICETSRQSIFKTRYIDGFSNVHLFETYDFNDTYLSDESEEKMKGYFLDTLDKVDDVLIVDYGHGFISRRFIDFLKSKKSPRVRYTANAQANAGNFGLNSISRYGWCDSIVLNGSEVQLEMRQGNLNPQEIIHNLSKQFNSNNILITLGSKGLIFKPKNGPIIESEAVGSSGILDKTGAGDALLSCFVALQSLNISENFKLHICNLAGYLMSKTLGNSQTLTLSNLQELAGELSLYE